MLSDAGVLFAAPTQKSPSTPRIVKAFFIPPRQQSRPAPSPHYTTDPHRSWSRDSFPAPSEAPPPTRASDRKTAPEGIRKPPASAHIEPRRRAAAKPHRGTRSHRPAALPPPH